MRPTDPHWHEDALIGEYLGSFSARQDMYVANGAGVVRAELTPQALRVAISHNYPLSGFMGKPDGTTHVGALDFDGSEGVENARSVHTFLNTVDIPSLLVASRRGAHLWVMCWGSVTAAVMYNMLKGAVGLALNKNAQTDPTVEVFPKRGTDLAYGALRMPGLPHHRDQQIYPVWIDGQWVSDLTFLAIVEAHHMAHADAVKRLAGSSEHPVAWPKDVGDYGRRTRTYSDADTPKASEVLMGWGVLNAKPGGTVLCPKHEDRRRSLTIFREDTRVICGAPHCVLNGGGHGVGSVQLSRMP